MKRTYSNVSLSYTMKEYHNPAGDTIHRNGNHKFTLLKHPISVKYFFSVTAFKTRDNKCIRSKYKLRQQIFTKTLQRNRVGNFSNGGGIEILPQLQRQKQ